MYDDTQNVKGVLVFADADQFFRCKVVDMKLSCGFLFGYARMTNLMTDTVIYIIESKLTKLIEKSFYCGTNFLSTL